MYDADIIFFFSIRDECLGIEDDGADVRKVLASEVEYEQARCRGDEELHERCDLKSVRSGEMHGCAEAKREVAKVVSPHAIEIIEEA